MLKPAAITLAIVPAAGYGTRMRPLTQAIPKEMLPLGRKPVLQYVVEELRSAGVRKIIFVVSAGKDSIERYFGDGSDFGVACTYVLQPIMRGLGDAILCAANFMEKQPALVAFGDCVIRSTDDLPIARLISAFKGSNHSAAVLTQRVTPRMVNNYGIVEPLAAEFDRFGSEPPIGSFALKSIVEKPTNDCALSNLAVTARWVITADVVNWLRTTPMEINGELNLTRAVSSGISQGGSVVSVCLQANEDRLDVGRWETYLPAVIQYAKEDIDLRSFSNRTKGES